MKVIDLLNKIANGEEVPEKIKIGTHILKKYDYPKGNGTRVPSYKSIDEEYHINDFLYPQYLNDEVEIIEDTPKEDKKIPEKLGMTYMKKIDDNAFIIEKFSQGEQIIVNTLNTLIDYLKSKGE